jgi:NDP-sugar pyrophosphorylase family protein
MGTRLRPYTRDRPKALVRLGRYSILEIILNRLRACGFERVTLCVSHLREMITEEIGDGRRLGLRVDYSVDERPLGTAAPLLLVEDWTAPAVVMNGDLLTTIDFSELHRTHRRRGSRLTVAFQRRRLATSVGVLQVRDDRITAMWEKPTIEWNVCLGVYVADPSTRRHIPANTPTDMPGLIRSLIADHEPVHGYQFTGEWHDIGTPAAYERARAEFLADSDRYLRPRSGDESTGADREQWIAVPHPGGADPGPLPDVSTLVPPRHQARQ